MGQHCADGGGRNGEGESKVSDGHPARAHLPCCHDVVDIKTCGLHEVTGQNALLKVMAVTQDPASFEFARRALGTPAPHPVVFFSRAVDMVDFKRLPRAAPWPLTRSVLRDPRGAPGGSPPRLVLALPVRVCVRNYSSVTSCGRKHDYPNLDRVHAHELVDNAGQRVATAGPLPSERTLLRR